VLPCPSKVPKSDSASEPDWALDIETLKPVARISAGSTRPRIIVFEVAFMDVPFTVLFACPEPVHIEFPQRLIFKKITKVFYPACGL
jgi:hypothetical protein